MSASPPGNLWLIGCGNMAGAMLRRWIDTGTVDPSAVFVVNRADRQLPAGVRQGRDLPTGSADAVLLGVKPQQLDAVAAAFGDRIGPVPLLLSILAGVEEATLLDRFHPAGAVIRAMPNLPVGIGKGVVALHSATARADERLAAEALMAPLGLVEWIGGEALFDAVTALSGCGPAFVYRFIDALTEAGEALGLPAAQAGRLALATVEGSGLLAAASDVPPSVLADRVASPGGSTREGLNVPDRERVLVALLVETLAAAARRNREMAEAARG